MIHCRCDSGSSHSEVPVKPLWPMASFAKALPPEVGREEFRFNQFLVKEY